MEKMSDASRVGPFHVKRNNVINFGPGPAKLPEEVMLKAQHEFVEYEDTGISVLGNIVISEGRGFKMSHRSKKFQALMSRAEKNLRDLMGIPSSYKVLFLQGGGTGQFAAVPLNLRYLGQSDCPTADYVVTGGWSKKAKDEASKYLTVHQSIDPPLKAFTGIPDETTWTTHQDSAYLYYCANETIHGVEFDFVPEFPGKPVVADISSNALSKPVDVAKHGILFAGTQKNLGCAGLTVVIVRDDLLDHACKNCPSILEYHKQNSMSSSFNTPPVYRCPVDKRFRSRMNIPVRIDQNTEDLEKKFLAQAEKEGMISLKGHRSTGGIRASLYNAITIEETQTLADFMKRFMEENGAA